jgi:hypothetical protein
VITRAFVVVSVTAAERLRPTDTTASVLDSMEKQVSDKDGVQLLGVRVTIRTESGLTGLMRGFLSNEEHGIIAVVANESDADNQSAATFVQVVAHGPTDSFLVHQSEVLELIRSNHQEPWNAP